MKKEQTQLIEQLVSNFDQATLLTDKQILALIEDYTAQVKSDSNLARIKSGTMLVVGDIHGDFTMLKTVFNLFLNENVADHVIFLGDIVDRGSQSVACVNLLLAFLLKYPKKVHFIRGNHETLSVNIRYGFLGEVIAYAGLEEQYQYTSFTQDNLPELYVAYNNAFGLMPLALLHEKTRYFFVHGGIPKEPISLKEIKQLPRSDLLVSNPIIMQLLWNDPAEDVERIGPSFRGDNIYTFGNELLEEFLTNNKVTKVIRAHQVFNDGFCYLFDDKLLSIFSSEEYYTTVQAKIALIDNSGKIIIHSPSKREN